MKPVLATGIIIVNLALIAYSAGIINQLRQGRISRNTLLFLTLGVLFDLTSTVCMVIGSSQGPVTLHGLIGYSSLAGMLTDTIFTYRLVSRNGIDAVPGKRFNNWSRIAYFYWILAYITGAVIIMTRH